MLRKRTRVLQKNQSKYGCINCKLRKLKCDEGQPNCLRCKTKGVRCEGYAGRFRLDEQSSSTQLDGDAENTNVLAVKAFQDRVILALTSSGQHYLGCEYLVAIAKQSMPCESSLKSLAILDILRLSHSANPPTSKDLMTEIDSMYGDAVRCLLHEISAPQHGKATLFISCCLLAAVELFQRRRQNAWTHVLGIHEVSNTALLTDDPRDINKLLLFVDLQILLYSAGVRRSLLHSSNELTEDLDFGRDLPAKDTELLTIHVLTRIHDFIAEAHHEALSDVTLNKLQFKYLQWLHRSESLLEEVRSRAQSHAMHTVTQSLMLQLNLCLMSYLILQQLFSTTETSWDCFVGDFRSIVENAEKLLLTEDEACETRSKATIFIGTLSPLRLVAHKCRDRHIRRRAIGCMQRAGVEGPFIGTLMAAVAQRFMNHEEAARPTNEGAADKPIAEHQRLTIAFTIENNGFADNNFQSLVTTGKTKVKFLRRKRPCVALDACVISSSYFRVGGEYAKIRNGRQLNPEDWEEWTEELEFGR